MANADRKYWWAHGVSVVTLAVCGFLVWCEQCERCDWLPVAGSDGTHVGQTLRGEVMAVFALRVTEYRADVDKLYSNMVLQVLLIVVALGAITTKSKELKLPGVEYKVPIRWACYVAPIALLLLWLQFGFAVDDLIESRSETWGLLSAIGDPKQDLVLRNAARLFEDGGFVDAWFVAFREQEHLINDSFLGGTVPQMFFAIIFGIGLGTNHACVFALLCVGCRTCFPRGSASRGMTKCIAIAAPWTAAMFLILSHVQFRYGGDNEGWFQLCVAVAAVAGVYGLLLAGKGVVGDVSECHS